MKKIKLLKILSLAPVLITPLVAASCGNSTVPPKPQRATDDQITKAIYQVAYSHEIGKSEINEQSLNYQGSTLNNGQETIAFSFSGKKNIDNEYLIDGYKGSLLYGATKKTFSLKTWNESTVPGFFNSSTNLPSLLIGTGEDFTVAIGNDDFYSLENLLSRPNAGLEDIFNLFEWNASRIKAGNFTKKLFMPLLKYTSIPPGHFAVFNIVSGRVVWTNLVHDGKSDYSLKVAHDGNLSSFSLLNQANSQYQLILNRSILVQLQELSQQTPDPSSNPYLQPATYGETLTRHQSFNQQSDDNYTGMQITNCNAYTNGNSKINDVARCLLSLLTSSKFNLTTILNNQFAAFKLSFTKSNGNWTCQGFQELKT